MADSLNIDQVRCFVAVVRAGSFRKAAQALAMPLSTLSDRIVLLEQSLGVALLVRTTRKLTLTEAGKDLHEHAAPAVQLLLEAGERISNHQREPAGTLRITAPSDFAHGELAAAIRDYQSHFPQVQVETLLTNRFVDLVAEGFDLAIRGGHLRNSTLIARRIGAGSMVLVAGRSYLASAPPLRHPRDLAQQRCMGFRGDEHERGDVIWQLRHEDGTKHRLRPTLALASSSLAQLREHAKLDAGVALLPWYFVRELLQQPGNLTRVLPQWATVPSPVHIVYPALRVQSAKTKEMAAVLMARLRPLMAEGGGGARVRGSA